MKGSQTAQGVVEAILPSALYRVRLEDGEPITASLSREVRHITVKLFPGDGVMVERSPYDPTRGRIKARLT